MLLPCLMKECAVGNSRGFGNLGAGLKGVAARLFGSETGFNALDNFSSSPHIMRSSLGSTLRASQIFPNDGMFLRVSLLLCASQTGLIAVQSFPLRFSSSLSSLRNQVCQASINRERCLLMKTGEFMRPPPDPW